ncbi:hypothetical protein BHM03_00035930 [Ensete ventricosum]|nr:hypothetical protein BHM03_00035930 [Ensete ventricosum]
MSSRARNLTFKLDTAGQERFHALGPIYYRDADGMYLINTSPQMASKDIVMVIAANKSDLIRSKNYDIQGAESYATTIGAKLFLTSAKSGTGINDVFLDIAARDNDSHVPRAQPTL